MYKYARIFAYREQGLADGIGEQRFIDSRNFYQKYKDQLLTGPCPICGYDRHDGVGRFIDTFTIVKCRRCRSIFPNPRPTEAMLDDYYNHAPSCRMLADFYQKENTQRTQILDGRCRMVLDQMKARERSEIRVLDIGCNNGSFLHSLKSFADEIHPELRVKYIGIDLDREAIELARQKAPTIEFQALSAEDFCRQNANAIDIVTMWQLIEHVLEPRALIQRVAEALVPGGKIVLTTPNLSGLEKTAVGYNVVKRQLAHSILPPMHLNAFSTDNMALFAYCCQMELEDCGATGKFDVDMVVTNADQVDNEVFRDLAGFDEATRAYIQALLRELNATGAMTAVLRKP